jgi:hypothetical protein
MAENDDKSVNDDKPEVPLIDFEKLKKRPRERVRSENFVSVYSNAMSIEMTFNDIKLFFGEIMEATPEKVRIEEHVAVTMSLEEAKAAVKVLANQIVNYEKTFGPVRELPE